MKVEGASRKLVAAYRREYEEAGTGFLASGERRLR